MSQLKTVLKTSTRISRIDSISAGDLFLVGGVLYMKLSHSFSDSKSLRRGVILVGLMIGCTDSFNPDALVLPVSGTLTWAYE